MYCCYSIECIKHPPIRCMYLVSDTSCHTLHWNSCWSLNAFSIWSTLSPGTSLWIPSESVKILFLKSSFCYFVYASQYLLLSDVFLPASCFCSVFSSARLWEPITAKPRSLLVFWFVELAQSLLRSFLFPVESLAGSVNCKMIGYSSSHENIMVYLLE